MPGERRRGGRRRRGRRGRRADRRACSAEGGAGAAPSPLPFLAPGQGRGRGSRGAVLVAAAAFLAGKVGEGVEGGAGIGVGVEAAAACGADAAPLAHEEGAAEQVGPDFQAVVAPFVAFGAHADQGGGVREQRQLDGGGAARALGAALGMESRQV